MNKKILSAILAAAMMISTGASAYAYEDNVIADETINIRGYSCYERDGNYWTMLDGIEYLVIDVGDSSGNYSRTVPYATASATLSAPPQWTTDKQVPILNGGSYTDTVDISSSNYCSPVYLVTPTSSDYRLTISCGFIFSNQYSISFYSHTKSPINSWGSPSTEPVNFSALSSTHVVLAGTSGSVTDAVALRFNYEASTGEKNFNYTITAVG